MGDPRNEGEAWGLIAATVTARQRQHITPGRGYRAGFFRRLARRILGVLT